MMTQEQKENHLFATSDSHKCVVTNEGFLKNIKIGDETWFMVMALKLNSHHHNGNPLPCHNCKSTPRVQQNQSDAVHHTYASQGRALTNIYIFKC
jgi:hypothetical protein